MSLISQHPVLRSSRDTVELQAKYAASKLARVRVGLECARATDMRANRSPRRPFMYSLSLPFILGLYLSACRPAQACAVATDGPLSTDTIVLCRACGHELAAGADIHLISSQLALSSRNDTRVGGRLVTVQLLQNPHGLNFEVITFRKADATLHWPADKYFSWFPGFSWTVATCPRCKTHLGWAFQPSDWPESITKAEFEDSEQTFLAFITDTLLGEDFASTLLVTPRSFLS